MRGALSRLALLGRRTALGGGCRAGARPGSPVGVRSFGAGDAVRAGPCLDDGGAAIGHLSAGDGEVLVPADGTVARRDGIRRWTAEPEAATISLALDGYGGADTGRFWPGAEVRR